jgi:hypothetical protein
MKTINKISTFIICLLFTGACTYESPYSPEEPTQGSSDFTKTVTVGSSLSAGFMNGALYDDGQATSTMAILADQMKLVGGGDFNQPDIDSENGYYGVAASMPPIPDGTILGRLYLKVTAGTDCLETPKTPGLTPKIPGEVPGAFAGDKTELNNFSGYGITIQTAQIPQLGGPPAANPYYNAFYARFASNPGTSTLIGDAATALADGTFFVFWLGADDVYAYALNGADENDPTKPLTPDATFDVAYEAAVNALLDANANANGALANIPSISSLPYFSTVKWNQVVFLDCNPVDVGTVAALNGAGAYGGYNAALDGLASGGAITQAEADARKVVFHTGANSVAGANAVVIKDETLPDLSAALVAINTGLGIFGQVRQATATDLITLPAGSVLPLGVGVNPAAGFLADKYVVLPSEQTQIQASIDHFNSTIAATVTANSARLVLVDANAAYNTIKTTSVTINGSSLTATIFPPNGAFSLDGAHLNARGSAYIANEFIKAINAKFGSNIPLCNPNAFTGNELPVP